MSGSGSSMGFQEFFEWLASALLDPWIMAMIVAGASILTLVVIRYRGRRVKREGEGGGDAIAGQEFEDMEGGRAAGQRAEAISEIREDLAGARARILDALRSIGALRPVPLAASKEGGHYPDIVGVSLDKAEDLVRELIDRGLAFEGDIEFSSISCPLCGSSAQVALASCKNCGSLKIHEIKYYRHTCGYVGPESSFSINGGLICPRCRSSNGIEPYYKRYHCHECKMDSDEVMIVFKCGSCGSLYDESNMALKKFRRIESSKIGLEEYEKINSVLNAQIQELRAKGYVVERPATLVGESGVVHSFEAVAKKGDEVIAITSALGKTLGQRLFELGIAKIDLKINRLIVITGKPASPAEKEFAKSLGIEVVEYSTR